MASPNIQCHFQLPNPHWKFVTSLSNGGANERVGINYALRTLEESRAIRCWAHHDTAVTCIQQRDGRGHSL